jgi:endonuclease/exonuclease/phosphatase (EEP) superfamily protein YafD
MSLLIDLQQRIRPLLRALPVAIAPKPAAPPPAPVPAPEVKSQPLKVMSFNYAKAEYGSVDQLAQLIKSNQVDTVALQEMPRDKAQQLQAALGPGWNLAFQGDLFMNGKAVLSRYPITGQQDTTFDKLQYLGESLANCVKLGALYPLETRGVQDVTLDVNGRQVHVFNAHLSNCNSQEKQGELQQLDQVLNRCSGERVCLGDLNTARGESPALDALLKDNIDGLALTGSSSTPTCGNRQIDFILGSEIAVQKTQVLNSGLSDHDAVLADLLV